MNTIHDENKIMKAIAREIDIFENAVIDENKALKICSREEIWNLIYQLIYKHREKNIKELEKGMSNMDTITQLEKDAILSIIR